MSKAQFQSRSIYHPHVRLTGNTETANVMLLYFEPHFFADTVVALFWRDCPAPRLLRYWLSARLSETPIPCVSHTQRTRRFGELSIGVVPETIHLYQGSFAHGTARSESETPWLYRRLAKLDQTSPASAHSFT